MRSRVQYSVIDAHSAGAPARVVVAGAPHVRGDTIAEIRDTYERDHDDVRKLLMYEPRGHSEMCGSILLPPCDPRADLGIVFIETGGWMTMCGAGTIGAATVVVECGMVPVVEPVTTVTFDTPAGLVVARVDVSDGVVQGVTIENVPSFLYATDQLIDVPGFGTLSVDIAYGGNFYVIASAEDLGLSVIPEHTDQLAHASRLIRDATNKVVTVEHPVNGPAGPIPLVILAENEPRADGAYRNLVFFGESGIDRSPGGTGTSARMAQRYGRGHQQLGDTYIQESIIGTQFHGHLTHTTQLGTTTAVIPTIRGRAHITAHTTFHLDPHDPYPHGFGVGYATDAHRH
ncbi:proline racemase family protein [Prauserella cavernicola]|uniref:Proline racemase family protein n=1 Tax=Prauserella cavernicola TaxID=2800127 RepID=A0A934QZ19_9PSEU|nr:proline racemase family protein [Prauserella cavernicola]MBK1787919.1 proline racemase family protein [Prauserella cavernicola]